MALNEFITQLERFSKNGINDLVDDKTKNTEIINNRLNINFKEGKDKYLNTYLFLSF